MTMALWDKNLFLTLTITLNVGPVAQPGRASAWHAGGRGFKSRPVHYNQIDIDDDNNLSANCNIYVVDLFR
jgi:hypothetical protein